MPWHTVRAQGGAAEVAAAAETGVPCLDQAAYCRRRKSTIPTVLRKIYVLLPSVIVGQK
jgi:hypothetical protein